MSSKEHAPTKKKEGREILMAFASLLAVYGTIETAKIGTHKIDIRAAYTETLQKMEREFMITKNHCASTTAESDGECISFASFLQNKGIPREEDVQALERLMGEFKYPVRVYSGLTIIQSIVNYNRNFLGTYNPGYTGWLPLSIVGHSVHIMENGEERQLFTTSDIRIIVAELGHAYQHEEGRNIGLIDIEQAFLDHENKRYDDPARWEYDAHSRVQPELHEHMQSLLNERWRGYARKEVLRYLDFPIDGPMPPFSYQEFEAFLKRVEDASNTYGGNVRDLIEAQTMMQILEDLPSFAARLEPGPKEAGPRIVLIPSEALYRDFLEMLRPYERPDRPITELVRRAESSPTHQALSAYDEYRMQRVSFFDDADHFRQDAAQELGLEAEHMHDLTEAQYEALLQALKESLEAHVNHKAPDAMPLSVRRLAHVVDNVCNYDPTCEAGYGVFPTFDSEHHMIPGPITTRSSPAHYQALRRVFARSRSREVE